MENVESSKGGKMKQFSTFFVAGRLYGLDVTSVQEITQPLPVTKVPLSPNFVSGLINLRGQIATAIELRELFSLTEESQSENLMNVVCRGDGVLLSLIVDKIGDVMEVDDKLFESTPETIHPTVSKFMSGVYKISGSLLSILDIGKIVETVQK